MLRPLSRCSGYDTTCIVLAEAVDAVLCACDKKLAKGQQVKVKVFAE